ncbi:hypothetical protein Tsubulata_051068 [Turnera subulata]|uniref:NAC domain-containing protein n=1 Tax=Turnera subulata TaxID=218843 RepID=A0A9Q0FJV3_9ROSI|nr:hypothetical protein Tsubulata_051068 [Turnera subulata]
MEKIAVPVGYKFVPTDEQLAGHYLYRKITGTMSVMDGLIVGECDLYGEEEPWEIWQRFGGRDQDDLYLFTKLKRVCSGGSQVVRKVGREGGNWHGEQAGVHFAVGGGRMTGYRKRLVYRNPNPGQHHSSWLMMEYSLTVEGHNSDYVLCRIRKNNVPQTKISSRSRRATSTTTTPHKGGSHDDSDDGSGAESSSSSSSKRRKRRVDHHQSSECQGKNIVGEAPQQQANHTHAGHQHQSSLLHPHPHPERDVAAAIINPPLEHSKIQPHPQPGLGQTVVQQRNHLPALNIDKHPWIQGSQSRAGQRVMQQWNQLPTLNIDKHPWVQDPQSRAGQNVLMQPWKQVPTLLDPNKHPKIQDHQSGSGRRIMPPWMQGPTLDLNKLPNMQDQQPGPSRRLTRPWEQIPIVKVQRGMQPPWEVKIADIVKGPISHDQQPQGQGAGRGVLQPWRAAVGAINPPKHSKTTQDHREPGTGQSSSSERPETALTCEEAEVVEPDRLSPTPRRIDLGQLCTQLDATKSCNIDVQIGPLRITIQENKESTGKSSNLDRPHTECADCCLTQ